MEELSVDNILGIEEINALFGDEEEKQETPPENGETESKEDTTEITVDDIISESESVGSEEIENQEREGISSTQDGSSPNFYSSIAIALQEDGILPDLDDEEVTQADTSEKLAELIQKQINAGLEEKQKRISKALEVDVETQKIRNFEQSIAYLESITEEALSEESDNGETLRKQIIYQDFINRGYSKERAQREVTKSFNAGTDIDDAKESLKSNKDFFNDAYDSVIEEAQKAKENKEKELKAQSESLKKSILEDDKVFGDLEVDKTTRKKIYESISKPVYKDPKTGELLTAIQKYEMDNPNEFRKNLALVFTLTDGFKNYDGLVKNKVKKEINKGLSNLAKKVENSSRNSDGTLRFVTSKRSSKDESYSGRGGWTLDV